MDELSRREHDVQIITSKMEKVSRPIEEGNAYPTHRKLHLVSIPMGGEKFLEKLRSLRLLSGRGQPPQTILQNMFRVSYNGFSFTRDLFYDFIDTGFVENKIRMFKPDVVYLGHMTGFSRAILPYLTGMQIPIVYDEGGSGLIDMWEERSPWYQLVSQGGKETGIVRYLIDGGVMLFSKLSRNRLKKQWMWPGRVQIIFNGELNRRNAISKGVPAGNASVIHSGIDEKLFKFEPRSGLNSPIVILIPGRIEPHKGQVDGVRLIAQLDQMGIEANLLMVGEAWSPGYYSELMERINKQGLKDEVKIISMLDHEALVKHYQHCDFCFFPSYQDNGFSRVPLEAMACGCVVISYGNEGSDEIIKDHDNGFLVEPGDIPGVANIIMEMIHSPRIVNDIAINARKTIEANYTMIKYVDQIEELITQPEY